MKVPLFAVGCMPLLCGSSLFRRAERHLFPCAVCGLTLNALCFHHGLIQLSFIFYQPLALSTFDKQLSIEARRNISLIQREAET